MGLGEDAPNRSDASPDTLRVELGIVNELFHTFLEWRHKVMVRFAVAIGAVIVALSAIPERDNELRAVALATGAVFALVAWLLDRVNQRLLEEQVYKTGADVETELELSTDLSIFSAMKCRAGSTEWYEFSTYHDVLQVTYLAAAVVLAASALFHIA